MSLLLTWNNGQRAFILSDGLALDGEGEVLSRDRRKYFLTASGAVIGACGFTRLCDELKHRFHESSVTFSAIVPRVAEFVAQANRENQRTRFSMPLGCIVIGQENGAIQSAEIGADHVTHSKPGLVHVAWVSARPEGFDEIGRFLGGMAVCPAQYVPDYLGQYAADLFRRFPDEAGGRIFRETIALDGCMSGNQQGSGNSPGDYSNKFSYTSTDASITWSNVAFSVPMPNQANIPIPSGGDAFGGLSASTTYYFGAYYDQDPKSATFDSTVVVLSDVSSGTAQESSQQVLQVINGDNHIGLGANMKGTTASSGNTGGGNGGGGVTCPAEDQLIETRENGFIPAGNLAAGMHVRGWAGEWNRIEATRIVEGLLHHITIAGERFHVDVDHRWLPVGVSPDVPIGQWKRSCNLHVGELVQSAEGEPIPVERVSKPHAGRYVKLVAERQRFRLGRVVCHNFLTV